jgi:uncharacterized protein YdbL (DUF1318 family)
MQSRLFLKLAPVVLLLSACVTINVYFPAAAAEEAADKIIEGVWGPGTGEQGPAKPKPDGKASPQSLLQRTPGSLALATAKLLEVLVPAARAAEADLNIATPAIRQLTQSMEARHAQLKQYYDSGAVGLTANGLIEVRDLNKVPLPERTAARKLVSDENTDRNNLYREIAVANQHPEWEADIRTTFAQRWIQRAAGGWYYNDGSGWKQK